MNRMGLNCGQRHRSFVLIKLIILTEVLLVPASQAQTPEPRAVAAYSIDDYDSDALNETAIAASEDRVMSVFHVLGAVPGGGALIGYAIAERDTGGAWAWTEEGVIDPNVFTDIGLTDPSVAVDTTTGDFLVCAIVRDLARLVVARYDGAMGLMGSWEVVATAAPNSYDKSWIVAGNMPLPGGEVALGVVEFYIVYQYYDGASKAVAYLRSRDGGLTWRTSCGGQGFALIDVNNCDTKIPMIDWPIPRVYYNRPLYVAYSSTQGIQIVQGTDINFGPHAGEVQFAPLLSGPDQPLIIPAQLVAGPNLWFEVPGRLLQNPRGAGIDMAVDPTDANRLYVVYHDLLDAQSHDVNIYLRVVTKSGSYWSFGPRILVADDSDPQNETDQFHPAVDVDSTGRIHVIYYDDRDFGQNDADECPALCPRFNVYHGYSTNQGQSWVHQNLCEDPPACATGISHPAIDFSQNPGVPWFLGDYIGIDVRGDRVWTSFIGSSASDPNPDKTLIWSSQIVLP